MLLYSGKRSGIVCVEMVVMVATYYTCVLVRTVSLLVVLCLAKETTHCSVTSSTSRVTLPFLDLHTREVTLRAQKMLTDWRGPQLPVALNTCGGFAECSLLTSIMDHTPLFFILGCWSEAHLFIVVS